MAVDWSQLPRDLVEKIGEKIDHYSDYVRFRAVCIEWRSSLPEKPKNLLQQFPCLIFPNYNEPNQATHCFLNLFLGEVYHLEPPEGAQGDKVFRGSSHGWVVTLEIGPSIYLIDPLSKAQLHLPPIHSFPDVLEYHPERVDHEYLLRQISIKGSRIATNNLVRVRNHFVEKIVLSSSPSNPNNTFVAMAIYGDFSSLAVCKLGDEVWTRVVGGTTNFCDIIFYKDKFYAVDVKANVYVVDLNSDTPMTAVQIAHTPKPFPLAPKIYLVESSSTLLLVCRDILSITSRFDKTHNFRVFKLILNSTSTQGYWSQQLSTIGDCVLFLGYNHSLSFSSHRFPGCKGDYIYFTDDQLLRQVTEKGGGDIGVFDYMYKTLLPIPGYEYHHQFLRPPPTWFIPRALFIK